jgi:hypothetical protein
MAVIVSDLLVPLDPLFHAIGRLQHDGHECIVIHVMDPDELELPFGDLVMFRDMEGSEEILAEPRLFRQAYRQAMAEFVGDAQTRCRMGGIDYVQLITDQDVGLVLSRYLHQRQIVNRPGRQGRRAGRGSSMPVPAAPATSVDASTRSAVTDHP